MNSTCASIFGSAKLITGISEERDDDLRSLPGAEKLTEPSDPIYKTMKDKDELQRMERALQSISVELKAKNAQLNPLILDNIHQHELLLKVRDNLSGGLKRMKINDPNHKYFRDIARCIDNALKEREPVYQFETLFDSAHQNFVSKLKELYPQLTTRDLRLCTYLRMNFTSKEIALALHLTTRGVEDLRYRIRKKIGLDSSASLSEFILTLNT